MAAARFCQRQSEAQAPLSNERMKNILFPQTRDVFTSPDLHYKEKQADISAHCHAVDHFIVTAREMSLLTARSTEFSSRRLDKQTLESWVQSHSG